MQHWARSGGRATGKASSPPAAMAGARLPEARPSPPNRIHFGTLHHLATMNGWVPSLGLSFNVEQRDASKVDITNFDDWPVINATTKPRLAPATLAVSSMQSHKIDGADCW